MGKIDDIYDAAASQYPEPGGSLPADLALDVGAAVIPIAGILKGVLDSFSRVAVEKRLRMLIEALNSKVNSINAKIESPKFAEAVRLAMEETCKTTDAKTVKRFAAVLGNSAEADDLDGPQNAMDFIRAVSQLADRDLRVLNILNSVNADNMKTYSNLHDPNPFTQRIEDVFKRVQQAGIHRDDFYSSCKRLEGFGLAIELPRNISRMQPGDYCFRPTRPGERLLALLGDVTLS